MLHHTGPRIWDDKTAAMTDAARLLALVGCISHENKHKSVKELKAIRRSLNPRSKRVHRRWRAELLDAPSVKETTQAMRSLGAAIDYLQHEDFNCMAVAASLLEYSSSLTGGFGQGNPVERRQTAKRHREFAAGLRTLVVLGVDIMEINGEPERNSAPSLVSS